MKSWYAIFLVSLSISFWSSTYAESPKTDLQRFQGEWVMVKGETNGRSLVDVIKERGIDELRIVFSKQGMSMSGPGGRQFKYRFELDPEKTPKVFDSTPMAIPGRELPAEPRMMPGIYAFEGDKLKLCLSNSPDVERPKEFKAPKESRMNMIVLKRADPK